MSAPRVNPHAGAPITDDDDAIAAALEEVSIPTLLCSLVHLTGDPSWIRRDEFKPVGLFLNEYQGFMEEPVKAQVRREALAAIAGFRDGGCVLPPPPAAELVQEMMAFLACEPVPDDVVPMLLEEMELDGTDAGAVDWTSVPERVKAECHVVVIGAGQSGLLAGIRLQQAGIPFTIVEKNSGPGGTWWENRYPGARVDVGSHFYCYSFEPADHWTEYFSQQPELAAYFVGVMQKYGLDTHIRFDTEVVAAVYDEDRARWAVTVRTADGEDEVLDARVVISAVGSLNRPKLPDITAMDTFAGPSFHSARWDQSVDYTGRRVAMIGAGASGFQIAPTIASAAEHLTIFQRTAQWMFPNPNYHEPVPEGDKWAMRHLPFYGRWFRFLTFWPACEGGLAGARIDPDWDDRDGLAVSERNLATRQFFLGWIHEQVGDDEELLAKVTPDYPATGKRTLQDNGAWLSCLTRDDVELVRAPIDHIEPAGVVADGRLHEADVIVYATGFHHNRYLWPMDIVGRGAKVLNEVWGEEPAAYLGITVPEFPNLFCMYGPGTNLAHGGSLIFHSECQITYIMGCLRELLTGGHRAMEPRREVHDAYYRKTQDEIGQMVWSHWAVTHSHYKNANGVIHTLSPWRLVTYWEWTRTPDPTEYLFA
ncbi:MAG: NAD(P)/FAD-dependent oxidoreductase [Acidimicrobiia bacterium]|nr:NAD(P)/FAD-dependent oxidoreductase [Acidimicrobiia bacterium]